MEEMRIDYSKYRLETAKKCLSASKTSFAADDMDFSLNRSYYAIFNSLRAVTILDRFDSKKHKGIISMIEPYLAKRWAEIIEEEKLPMSAIFTRTSTRQFESRPVESKYIIKILRAAMAAPSACNQQPWEFWVTDDKEIIARLSKVSPYATPVKNAPVVIVPCYRTEGLPAAPMAEIDMAMATQNILLEAEELGLGAVMIGIAPLPERMEAVGEILHLPENFRAFTIIPVGWPLNKRPQEDRYEPAKIHTL